MCVWYCAQLSDFTIIEAKTEVYLRKAIEKYLKSHFGVYVIEMYNKIVV